MPEKARFACVFGVINYGLFKAFFDAFKCVLRGISPRNGIPVPPSEPRFEEPIIFRVYGPTTICAGSMDYVRSCDSSINFLKKFLKNNPKQNWYRIGEIRENVVRTRKHWETRQSRLEDKRRRIEKNTRARVSYR